MCGICGKLAFSPSARVDERIVERMAGEIVHRGPDDHGFYTSGQVALGHRRLSIIDLGTGKQPICNEDRTVWIVYNGEIYNFKELKKDLVQRGHHFRTETDTEVIVHLYEEEGAECVRHLRGMFAFALWDERKRRLLLARDRVGIKPLYYCRTQDSLLFASEIKALLADPAVTREIDPQTIDRFLTYFYTPGPETLLRGIRKLEPGHYLVVEDGKVTVQQYWDLQFTRRPGPAPDLDKVAAELVTLLADTVRDHMISDVPVGVLLSGGVDSTAMLSFAVQGTEEKVRTFTVGFSGAGFPDERPYASLAARQFGNEHHEMSLTATDFLDFLPKYVWHMEEPVCEPPAVALYYVTKLAREYVKVLISGEGGDEAFAGYQNYRNTVWLERFKSVDGVIGRGASHMIEALHDVRAFHRFQKYACMLRLPLQSYYYSRTSGPFSWFNRAKQALYQPGFLGQLDPEGTNAYVRGLFRRVAGDSPLNQMLYVDTKTWLPDDLLIKADKITMANSLELRVPLLDHKVLEFAAALPASSKVRGFTTKYILKKAFQGRIPKEILSRKKTGFPVPYAAWLRHELRDFVWDLLLDRRALERGYFQKSELRTLLDKAQRDDFASELFSLVTLELWHRQFLDSTSAAQAA